MKKQKRLRDYGITIGSLPTGARNTITDVEGVTVGHTTLDGVSIKTGVTAILPHPGNLFRTKVMAATHVINGFGKSIGTIQVDELGAIETPILLTNTLSAALAADSLIHYMLEHNPEIGLTTGTVNPLVGECNDGYLNDIRGGHVTREHVFQALTNTSPDFEEGAVGAGTGMTCYGLKGGIGSSSRLIRTADNTYTLGVLVLSNFGRSTDFMLAGIPAGQRIHAIDQSEPAPPLPDKGSIIIVLATDAPLTERQLKRIAKRADIGLIRTGSYLGHGSGDIVFAFTTANTISHFDTAPTSHITMWNENNMDDLFRAVGEATEEAILNSMLTASTTTGRDGNTRRSLAEYIDQLLP